MSVRLDGKIIRLEGDCWVEEAETLAQWLADGHTIVDVGACGRLHSALIQALLVYRPRVEGEPPGEFLRHHLLPRVAKPLDNTTSRGTMR